VTRFLRDSIMSGEYQQGTRIRLEELAARLNVSTMPAREALMAMVSEGLLEPLPRRGYRVVALQRQDIEDVFAVHAFVAGHLAERAAALIGKDDIAKLEDLQREAESIVKLRISKRERAVRIDAVNFEFHRLINQVAEAPRLRWFLRAATRYVPRHFYQAIPSWTDATVADHPKIIEALRHRNAAAARRLTEDHIRHAGRLVIEHLTGRGFWK
jgi:DNA-binding GntR family transcriptional regulator